MPDQRRGAGRPRRASASRPPPPGRGAAPARRAGCGSAPRRRPPRPAQPAPPGADRPSDQQPRRKPQEGKEPHHVGHGGHEGARGQRRVQPQPAEDQRHQHSPLPRRSGWRSSPCQAQARSAGRPAAAPRPASGRLQGRSRSASRPAARADDPDGRWCASARAWPGRGPRRPATGCPRSLPSRPRSHQRRQDHQLRQRDRKREITSADSEAVHRLMTSQGRRWRAVSTGPSETAARDAGHVQEVLRKFLVQHGHRVVDGDDPHQPVVVIDHRRRNQVILVEQVRHLALVRRAEMVRKLSSVMSRSRTSRREASSRPSVT